MENQFAQEFEQLCEELQRLRRLRDQADSRFLLRLMQVEKDEQTYLRSNGFDTFEGFARTMVEWARYAGFKKGVARIGSEAALEIGSAATFEAGKTTSNVGAREFVEEMKGWVDGHGGMLPSAQTARRFRQKIDPQKEPTRRQQRSEKLAQLEAENRRLRADIRTLEAEIKKLKAENRKLKAENRKLKDEIQKTKTKTQPRQPL